MAPALLRKAFEKIRPREYHDKLLPSSRNPKTSRKPVTEGSETGTYRKPPGTESGDRNTYDIMPSSIQICPHETLSFDRVKRIVRLPYFKSSGDDVCAFTNAQGHYHVSSKEQGEIYRCKPCPEVFKRLKAKAYYIYERSVDPHFDGLSLYVDWTMKFDDDMDVAGSLSDFTSFLDTLEIELCQHMRMGDAHVAAKLYRLCNSGPTGDPVEAYNKMQRRRETKCPSCSTTYDTYREGKSCHVLVRRCLGKGISAHERVWLDQCGEGKQALRNRLHSRMQIGLARVVL